MNSTLATVSRHAWKEQTFREPTYQVAFGVERTCQVCQRKQFTDYTSGRTGGNWVEVIAGADGEPKFDQSIDTSTGCKLPESS
jgi:predicted secreted protein